MSKIQINSLQTAGSELFDSSESFLTELQATEAHAIYGGKSKKKGSGKSSKKGSGKSSRRGSSGNSSGRTVVIVPVPFPFPTFPHPRYC
jgi:hypothetical protein